MVSLHRFAMQLHGKFTCPCNFPCTCPCTCHYGCTRPACMRVRLVVVCLCAWACMHALSHSVVLMQGIAATQVKRGARFGLALLVLVMGSLPSLSTCGMCGC